jgi:hypothetical protein
MHRQNFDSGEGNIKNIPKAKILVVSQNEARRVCVLCFARPKMHTLCLANPVFFWGAQASVKISDLYLCRLPVLSSRAYTIIAHHSCWWRWKPGHTVGRTLILLIGFGCSARSKRYNNIWYYYGCPRRLQGRELDYIFYWPTLFRGHSKRYFCSCHS